MEGEFDGRRYRYNREVCSRPRPARTKLDLILLFAFVLAIRLPFLTQAIGGDDVYYLAAAYHGLVDPLHPNHIWYVFGGRDVTFQGYPHPPGNAWFLCGLLAMVGDVHEVVFHAAYVVFSLLAVFGMYALARRFAQRPLAATLLCGVVPPFVVNGSCWNPMFHCSLSGSPGRRLSCMGSIERTGGYWRRAAWAWQSPG